MSLSDWLARCDGAVGLVLTDVVRSTSLLYEAKTVRYTGMLRQHRKRAAELVGGLEGRLVDQSGDELLAAFPDATRAYLFARDLFADAGHPSLRIRAGVHFGRVSAEEERVVGRNVHFCARVMQRGFEPELWLSDAARRAIEAESAGLASEIAWLESDDSGLKGIPDPQRLWRVA